MFRPVLYNAMVAAAIVLGSHAAQAENRIALVIGQSAYRAVTPLPNPANDAKAITQLLGDAGFEVLAASDLSQNELREKVGDFAARIAAKGPDTTALVFYAGHGLQIDGENFLVPVDIDPKREADIPLQAVRLNDILNTLTSVPSKARIILLDACRNNPFPAINKTSGHGLAIVDAKVGAAGTFVSYSTSPGAEAEDGSGADSPYTAALLKAAREPGLSIEEAFKRVRVSVNQATEGRQTPWDSSSLTSGFSFFGQQSDGQKPVAKRTVDDWRRELQGKPPEVAHEMIVSDGTDEAYEAFVGLFAAPPFGPQAREWLDRHRRLVAWNRAVIGNTAAAYREFLITYPDSDLTATARKLEERMRNRPNDAAVVAAAPAPAAAPTNVALTCPCGAPLTPPTLPRKADLPAKRIDSDPPKRVVSKPPRRVRDPDDDIVVVRRPPPVYYEPSPGPVVRGGIGIGIGGYGGNYGGRGRY
ncbi:MAG: peptidase caspase catalytic subunit p20 [Tardiphaga sp.]|nr:peptidase caspase catalytic subunit p20 [Tardiphaga sp.]